MADGRDPVPVQKDCRGLRITLQEFKSHPGHLPVVLVDCEALAGDIDRRLQCLLQWQAAVGKCKLDKRSRNPGDTRRQRPLERILRRLAIAADIHLPAGSEGSSLTCIEHRGHPLFRPVQQVESATANSRGVGLDHSQNCCYRDGRIEGIASLPEDTHTGLCGRRVRGGDSRCRRLCRGSGKQCRSRQNEKKCEQSLPDQHFTLSQREGNCLLSAMASATCLRKAPLTCWLISRQKGCHVPLRFTNPA